MRLFVALEIPRALRDELDRHCRALRGGLPKARWVRPEAMHLTLRFLGETDPAVLPALHRELEAAFIRVPAFSLRLDEPGVFPPRGKSRVIWTGIAGADGQECEELSSLRDEVAGAVHRGASVEPEKRPFHPHLTLARCSPPWPRGPVERFLESFGESPGEAFPVHEGHLVESELHPSGARYRIVRSYPLGGST